MKKITYMLFCITLSTFCTPEYNGFCSVPVADLLGGPVNDFFSTKSIEKAYKQLPYAEKSGNFSSPRIAQILFNQPVIIKEQRGKELKIELPYLVFSSDKGSHFTYWTLASNITKLTKYNKPYVPFNTKTYFTLKNPATLNGTTYTAGTQFVCVKKYKHKTTVYAYNSKTDRPEKITIKNSLGVSPPQDFKNKQKLFVTLCKEWANQKNGFIPYVFGGLSIGNILKEEMYNEKKVTFTKPKSSIFYVRPNEKFIKIGVDCARMISKAAQISNLPLYAINTKELRKALKPLKQNESVEDGDILIWKGHVAIISNAKKGLIVEARSYDSGYGRVHEIPYSKQLKDITSTQKLVDAHFAKPRITRLNKNGTKSHFIYDLEILKLSSLN